MRVLAGYVLSTLAGAFAWAWVCRHDDKVLRGDVAALTDEVAALEVENETLADEVRWLRRACGVRSLPARTAR